MDCVFLDDERKEEDALPELFDVNQVDMLTGTHCMLCSHKFGSVFMIGSEAENCSRCGKAVCDPCSSQKRRLSKLEKKKYRVCDLCDTVLSNYNLD